MLTRLRRGSMDDDSGSAILTVMIVVLVLGLITVTLSTAIVNTTRSTASVRGSLQAQASADAGIAAAVAAAKASGADPCAVAPASTVEPRFRVNGTASQDPAFAGFSACPTQTEVVFRSVGYGDSGTKVVTEARYPVTRTAAAEPSIGADMVFFGSATFTGQVLTGSADGRLLDIKMANPAATFTCQTAIPANFTIAGNFESRGQCDISGNVTVAGTASMSVSTDRIRGDLTTSGSGASQVGVVNGTFAAAGDVNFAWGTRTVPGSVRSSGAVKINDSTIGGSITLPSSKSLQKDGWVTIAPGTTTDPRVGRGISWPASVTAPAAPTFDPWFEYKYKASDWPGYTAITLSTAASGLWTCDSFNKNNAGSSPGWPALSTLTSPTIIDARACANLTSNQGTSPTVTLKTNVVFLAKAYNLNGLTMTTADSTTRNVWWITEDTVADGKPSCTNGAGEFTVISGVIKGSIRAMAYTPCLLSPNGGEWRGAFYAGSYTHGGGMKFTGVQIALPGQGVAATPGGGGAGTSTITLGDKPTSRKDVG